MTKSSQFNALNQLQPLRKLFAYIWPYRLRLLIATLALLVTSAITLLMGQGLRMVIDQGIGGGSMSFLNGVVIVLLCVTVVYAMAVYVRFYLVTWLGERVSADIRQAVFEHIVELHPSYFEENSSGEIASRLTTDTSLLQSIIGSEISMALRSSITATGGLIMMGITNLKLMAVVLAVIPAVVIPLVLFGRKVKRLARASQDSIADVGSYASEIIQNIKTVQSYTQENTEKKRFGDIVEHAFGIAKQRISQRALLMAAVMLLLFVGLAVMVWIGGRDVINGDMSGGELAAFVFYAMLVALGMATISEVYGELQRAAGATERLLELLAVESLIDSPAERAKATTITTTITTAGQISLPIIQFKQVEFSYPSRQDTKAIAEFSLDVLRGSSIALVGASGAGKSTVFELLQRFYDVQQGEILIDGRALPDYDPKELRAKMAIVAQQPILFSGDVASNIRYADPDATDKQIRDAAIAAHADEFIKKLPQGYNSFLGDRGVRLSGGQRQRVAIARALLKDPEILLLDEATSALDSESEHQVQQALIELMQSRTTIVIAHRLSTIMNADQIIVMDSGRIVETGKHNDLMSNSARYAELARHQFDRIA